MLSKWCWQGMNVLLVALVAGGVGEPAHATDIQVNDGDELHATGCAMTGTGTCTLRDAITFANSNPGPDVILLPKVVISPRSALPPITDSVTLNGTYYPVPGFRPVIDGTLAGPADGLVLAADQSAILGVAIRNFEGTGIVVLGSNNTLGRFIPPPCTGGCPIQALQVGGNAGHGIEIRGGANNTLGFGSASLNGGNGIYVHAGATSNVIGESEYRASFGTGGNRFAGIRVGDGPGDTATRGNTIRGLGDLSGNGGLPIDLGGDGVTPNDSGDADTGPNGRQNFPSAAVALVSNDGVTATVSGVFEGAPNAEFTLRFYFADTGASPFLGTLLITTGANGSAAFGAPLPLWQTYPPPNSSLRIVATATDAAGNTSELSGPVEAEPPTALAFHTVAPCRLLDTREAEGQGGPALTSGRPRTRYVSGNCGVSPTARAVVVNVTVTNPTARGHVHLAPTPWPADTSTINFQAGQTRANSAVVTLDPFGRLAANPLLEGSGTVDLILDVSGYFE
jgi:hypothetical protein